ncbi:MAG: DUF6111 family protein, partial [Pseudomonadota bacterium]|nr:DUF6111 family protein [Pseudomonadota bacterium]
LVAFAAWRLTIGRGGPSGTAVAAAAIGIVLVGIALIWFGVRRSLPPDAPYLPAHFEHGRVVPPDSRQ